MIDLFLRISLIRQKVLFHLKQNYFHELNHVIPLGSGYNANLMEKDSYDSFSEIFIEQEYEKYLPNDDILKVLDIGANYGFFSLWLQTKFIHKKLFSLLIEPSAYCRRSLEKLISEPKLSKRFHYLRGAIGNQDNKVVNFFERPFMASSIFNTENNSNSSKVNIIKENEIIDYFTPPYDLIKCDVEGSEWDLLIHYPNLLKNTKYLVLEWHSWHSGGGSLPQIEQKLTDFNFQVIKSSPPQKAIGRDGEVGLFLAKNLNFQN